MGLDSKELGIDLNYSFSSAKSFSDVLTEISVIDDIDRKLVVLNEYVSHLEEELRKVDGFKRELPLSMNLLTDAILKLKEEVLQLNRGGGVKEKVTLLKGNSDKTAEAEVADKKDWLNSVQLWGIPVQLENSSDETTSSGSKFLHQSGNKESEAGKRSRINPFVEETWNNEGAINVSLSIPVAPMESKNEKSMKQEIVPGQDRDTPVDCSLHQQSKKQRRCWSQELQRSFVNALMQLGGPEAATPKQIREIMQVDSLTNDEVKSHLQKYRIHNRKVQSAGSSSSSDMPNSEYWPRRYETKVMAMAPSALPDGPLHLGGSEKGLSLTISESVDEEEDTKSESLSWKGHFFKTCKVFPV